MTDKTDVTDSPKLTLEQKVDTLLEVAAKHQRGLLQIEADVYALRFVIVFAIVIAGAFYLKGAKA